MIVNDVEALSALADFDRTYPAACASSIPSMPSARRGVAALQ